jgi:N-acetylglucosaminyldiphosphoundecaprenol N-acetyl-beta-D-mannosaminyltransferase
MSAAPAVAVRTRVDFLGVGLDPVSLDEAIEIVERSILERRLGEHACISPTTLMRALDDMEYLDTISSFSLVTADGQSVVWVSRWLGAPVPERVAGADLMMALLPLAADRGYGVYLLGATPDVLRDAEAAIERSYPGIRIVGSRHGYFQTDEEADVVADISRSAADLLFIAMPTPQKEYFVASHRTALNVAFALGVGGTFDIVADRTRRAPGWMQRYALEWVFRLAQEPRRLARRFLVANARYIVLVAKTLRHRRSAARALETKLGRRSTSERDDGL